MRNSKSASQAGWRMGLLAVWMAIFVCVLDSAPQAPGSAEGPVVKGGGGTCSADFVVTDSSGKGLYDAKIRIQLRYGFLGARRLELEVGTNAEGKARLEGLPDRVRRPTEFKVQRGGQSKSVPYDPEANCHARHEVTLGEKPAAR